MALIDDSSTPRIGLPLIMFDFDIRVLPPEVLESLLALALCAIVVFRGVINFLFGRAEPLSPGRRIATEGFFWLVGVLLICFFAADLNRVYVNRIDPSMLLGLGIFSAVAILGFATIGFAARFGSKLLEKNYWYAAQVVHLSLLVAVGCWFTLRTSGPAATMITEIPVDSLSLMSEDAEYLAITDAGTQLPLFAIDLRDSSGLTRSHLATSMMAPTGAKVIPRADANLNANCHGWVFTGGKHLLRGRSVEQILLDNGYLVQGAPAAGDLIVYRNDAGELLHTGIVSGILLDGTCIIESKWGISGRFLHQAEDQPYGLNYAFYRSERSGHLVTIIHRNELDSFLTTAPPSHSTAEVAKPSHSESIQSDSELDDSLSD